MTLKRWVLWLCLAALLVGEFFLFSANRQRDAAQVALREARQEAGQLRDQLDQLKNSSVATLSGENARLRKESQGLSQKNARLQAENNQLRGTSQRLAQQLATMQQQPPPQTEEQPAMASEQPAEPPEPPVPPEIARRNACINNLRLIDAAKQQWALENSKTDEAVPVAQDLLPYFRDGIFPMCPSGGQYLINAVAVPPACTVPGHVLPP